MNEEKDFELNQIVWYMDGLWAHVGRVERKRVTTSRHGTLIDYEINDKWIPNSWVYPTKQKLKDSLIHSIDHNSPKDI